MAGYDRYYKTEELFGEPYPELLAFFRQYEPKGTVIDLGCGQGRDAIHLAALGYRVTGMDASKVGIDQLNAVAEKEKLNARGVVGDIYKFENYGDFDIVLLDSMFHFDKRDKRKETDLILRIAQRIKPRGVICFCIQDTGKKVSILKDTLNSAGAEFEVLNDSSMVYKYEDKQSGHTSETNYCMYIVRKC
ncbi:class I SAM-dependent methyltransferase [Saccharicrinis sp. FJH2]|uniref:class I SAM-dependent methyltransferase n=1 Tax=Saccharicrinis sp. FJH65 TaxID=3344659 RepID=UPI0035F4B349